MRTEPLVRRPGLAKGVTIGGQPMAFLVTGEHTQHTSMFEWTMPAGFATGMHVHRVQEETFYVLAGCCEWWLGEERVLAPVGTFLFVPPGTPHNITNPGNRTARVLMTVSPPGHERYFEELAAMTSGGTPDAKAVGELRGRYDTNQLSGLTASS